MALRLAARGGRLDIERQLDGLSPREFDEWVAFRRIEPDPDDRLREIVKLGFAALCRAWGMEISPHDLDPWAEDEAAELVSPNQAAATFRQHYGF
jgi:hypothetical protein